MREILFRGKGTIDGEWKYGYYAGEVCKTPFSPTTKQDNIIQLGSNLWCEVVPDTVGQFTGLTDKNGTKIFEGDIVEGIAYSGKFVGIIVWIDEIGGFGVRYKKRQEATAWENSSILKCASKGRTDEFTAEIIGNIYDNPELIGETENVKEE